MPQPTHIYASALSRRERRSRHRRPLVRPRAMAAAVWLGGALWALAAVLPGGGG